MQTVDLGAPLRAGDIWAVAVDHHPAMIGPAARAAMDRSAALLGRLVRERRRIYGVTTGYGPLAAHYVTPELASELQQGLVRHLASGVGAPLSPAATRAVMAARLACLARGHSGVGRAVTDLLLACLNHDLLPIIPEMGTVGASGDLTPLAHIALALMGDGPLRWQGRDGPAAEALAAFGLAPIRLGQKEGLALVNGTSAMTGIAALNTVAAGRAAHCALALAAAAAEILGAKAEAYDPRLGTLRPHPGQIAVHARLRLLLADSRRVEPAPATPPVLDETAARDGVMAHQALPQDAYTLRCLPQIFGAVLDALAFHESIVDIELGSVTDNPVLLPGDDDVVHGGNFYGQHVAFASDALAPAVITLAVHAERLLARLCDPAANGGLPAFLAGGAPALTSGLMGAQVTASALVAEMRILAVPASIQSIPTNGNNQDVVPLGTIAARRVARLLELLWHVLAIEALAVAQAHDLLGGQGFSAKARALVGWVRGFSERLGSDRALSADITRIAAAAVDVDWVRRFG